MSTTISSKVPDPITAYVWADTNRVTSDAKFHEVIIGSLLPDAKEPWGTWAKVDGRTKLGGVFKWEPFVNTTLPRLPRNLGDGISGDNIMAGASIAAGVSKPPKGGYPTNDGFDQVQLYNSLTSIQLYLVNLGFDVASIIGNRHGGKHHPVSAHANAIDDLNAWYSPQSCDLTFGTSKGKWHLASDNDVSNHEFGHLLLDHVNRGLSGWYSGEGGAIHEGFGDALAALYANDPEVSEDFVPALGDPADKGKGLRTLENSLRLKDVGNEVHDRGQVYGGFWWSVKKRIEGSFGISGRKAADITIKMLVNHGSFYRTTKPKPADFVKAVVAGTLALKEEGGKLGVPFEELKAQIVKEAIARGLIRKASEAEGKIKKKKVLMGAGQIVDSVAATSSRLSFTSMGIVKAIGGSREDYQQWYSTADGQKVRVVGGGMTIYRNAMGRETDSSTDDVRSIKFGEIIEQRNIEAYDALKLVQRKASRELLRVTQQKASLEKLAVKSRADRENLKQMQMEYRVALAATEKAAKLEKSGVSLVLLPGEKELSYEFKMGLSLYYVNSRTGRVRIENDVKWD
ncbi:MAG TPA: hypothetical protein PLZ86_01185 [bacterium]|nr:hypothetical protein [bacterium]